MEGTEGINFGVEAPKSFQVQGIVQNPIPNQTSGSTALVTMTSIPPADIVNPGPEIKKKRGRPRKYGPDGITLSPMPISSSVPLGKPRYEKAKKQHKYEFESSGHQIAYSVGGNFTPHVITVNRGEDVTMKISSFSQQGSRAICILSANGAISNVTLRQANTFGGTLTYEGRFEILSLTGSFMPSEGEGTKSRSGGMSVSLAGPDGRVVGGGLAGLLVAAGPVQVVLGSFLSGHQPIKQKPKKQKVEGSPIIFNTAPREINCAPLNPMHGPTFHSTENKMPSAEEGFKGPSRSNEEFSN